MNFLYFLAEEKIVLFVMQISNFIPILADHISAYSSFLELKEVSKIMNKR
jgi:hypothetical protein